MKKILFWGVLSVIIGMVVAAMRLFDFEGSKALFKNGSWMGTNDLPLGKEPLITAQVTLFALYALPSEEAVYLFARKDNEGNLLNANHEYQITGNLHQVEAKYWSITAYGRDLFLIPNKENRFSFNGANIQADSAGNFTIILSSKPHEGNWLPTAPDSRFNLLFRIYRGNKDFIKKLKEASLPEIKIVKQS